MRTKKLRFPGRFKGRKAQAESQLNWIFILIVGAVILAFFAFIVIKQRASSEAKFAGKVTQQLNTILVGAKVSSGTVQEIPTPDLSIRFTCNDYYIGTASQRLGNRLVFAPEYLEGNKLITWTMDWNVPFKITSFLYMTSPFVRYVIVSESSDNSRANELIDSLPAKLNKDTKVYSMTEYNTGTIREEGDRYVRFIFVDVDLSETRSAPFNVPDGFEGVDVSGLVVSTTGRTVQFLEIDADDATLFEQMDVPYKYIEKEELYGAIFTDKHDNFDCLMKRAYARFNTVAKVYFEKLNAIAPIYYRTNCEGHYGSNTELGSIIQATEAYPPDYAAIGSSRSALVEKNDLLQIYSCPLIY